MCETITKKPVPAEADNGRVAEEWHCHECGGRLLYNVAEAAKVCESCGITRQYQEYSAKQLYHEGMTFVTPYVYNRNTHFKTVFERIQNKEAAVVPEKIIEKVRRDIERYRVKPEEITNSYIRDRLKAMKENKYYGNCSQIRYKITGQQVPQLTAEQEGLIYSLFEMIQTPFENVKSGEGK